MLCDKEDNMEEKNTEPAVEEQETRQDEATANGSNQAKQEKRWKKPLIITLIVIGVLAVSIFIYSDYLLNKIHYDKDNGQNRQEYFDQDENAEGLDEVDPNDVVWQGKLLARHEEDVINILLVGEEAILDGGHRGRTDSIMIATINVKQKTLKLTSIMRDLYLQIPGYSDNKINAAFNIGGMDLLVQALNQNFSMKLDGYVKVDFDSFEKVIDALGGVEITLSAKEAQYLNTTNYISNPAYRNVREGKQILNGNQALGYSRIRYVANGDQANDFGRTQRQRTVLTALFEKYKEKNAVELLALLPDILSLVTTDLSKTTILEYMYLAVTLHPDKLETMRIPVDEAYYAARIREMAVLVPDTLEENVEALHGFVFGDENEES